MGKNGAVFSSEILEHTITMRCRNTTYEHDLIKLDIKEVGLQSVDWIQHAQIWNRWWALVYMIMVNCVCLRRERLLISEEGLRSVELAGPIKNC